MIEFNRDDKRILVSHLRYLDDIKRDATDEDRKQRSEERRRTSASIKKQQSKLEVTTLGELDALSQIKEQLEGDSAESTDSEEDKK